MGGISLLALAVAVACGGAATQVAPTPTTVPAVTAAPIATGVPAANPTPTAAPTSPPRARVSRLVVALSPPGANTYTPWLANRIDVMDLRSTVFESLMDVDQETGSYIPGLATKWEMTPDGKTWTFTLRKGVPFHDGFGEFTAKDVVHSAWIYTQEKATGPDTPQWRVLLGTTEGEISQNVQIVDNYQVVFGLKTVDPDLHYLVSRKTDMFMLSKAFWDREGLEGYKKRPIGTGSYKFKEGSLGQFNLFERVENHWRHTPEFKEIQFFYPPEHASRLGMLLAGEAHISDIPRFLQKDAVAKGMKTVSSKFAAQGYFWLMGGLHFATPEKLDPKLPFVDKRVREAMNRAINRKEIIENIFGGTGLIYPVHGFLADEPGYNPQWEAKFEERYGYDPVRAKALLAEAGYPNGFSFKIYVYPWPGLPENVEIAETLALYYSNIGLKPELVNLEFSRVRELFRIRALPGAIWGLYAWAPSFAWYRFYNTSKEGSVFSYEHPDIDKIHEEIKQTVDAKERARLLQSIGDHKFEEYAEIPLVRLFSQLAINPNVVGEYIFPGTTAGSFTHLEYVKPAP